MFWSLCCCLNICLIFSPNCSTVAKSGDRYCGSTFVCPLLCNSHRKETRPSRHWYLGATLWIVSSVCLNLLLSIDLMRLGLVVRNAKCLDWFEFNGLYGCCSEEYTLMKRFHQHIWRELLNILFHQCLAAKTKHFTFWLMLHDLQDQLFVMLPSTDHNYIRKRNYPLNIHLSAKSTRTN